MDSHSYPFALSPFWYSLALLLVLLCPSCDRQTPPIPQSAITGQVRNFTGTWTTTGNRQTMELGPGHESAIFRYTGSLLLGGPQSFQRGFKAEVIGLVDNRTGMQGRCVWTDERGEKVFSSLQAAPDSVPLLTGRFLGGTGRYAGVTGEYTFKWQKLIENEDGDVSGRVIDLKGWARLESPGGQQ